MLKKLPTKFVRILQGMLRLRKLEIFDENVQGKMLRESLYHWARNSQYNLKKKNLCLIFKTLLCCLACYFMQF